MSMQNIFHIPYSKNMRLIIISVDNNSPPAGNITNQIADEIIERTTFARFAQ